MKKIIIACSSENISVKIKNLLFSSGIPVHERCSTASQVLSSAERMSECLIICYALTDMNAYNLAQMLPPGADLIVFSKSGQRYDYSSSNVLELNLPINARDLVESVRMLAGSSNEYYFVPKKSHRQSTGRTDEEQKIINRAKEYIMDKYGISEPSAHRLLQKRSMNEGKSLIAVAKLIIEENN